MIKRSTLILLFCLVLAGLCAQTRPSWEQLQNAPIVSLKEFAASGDSTIDHTALIQRAINSGKSFVIPEGTWKFTNLQIGGGANSNNGQIISGAGNSKTILNCTATSGWGLTVVNTSSLVIRDLQIQGNSTASGGISLGIDSASYSNVAQRIKLENLLIKDFTAEGAAGISLFMGLEVDCENVVIQACFYGVHRPAVTNSAASFTTFKYRGANSYIGLSGTIPVASWSAAAINAASNKDGIGVAIDSNIAQMRFEDTVFENNAAEAVFWGGSNGRLLLRDCYFEENNHGGEAQGCLYLTGAATSTFQANISSCDFVTTSAYTPNPATFPSLLTDRSTVTIFNNIGLWTIGRVVGGSNAKLRLLMNSDAATSETPLTQYPVDSASANTLGLDAVGIYPTLFGDTMIFDSLNMGKDLPWRYYEVNADTHKILSGTVVVGDCSVATDVPIFRMTYDSSSGGELRGPGILAYLNISQDPSGNAPARTATGWFLASAGVGSSTVPIATDIKMDFSTPFPGSLTRFVVASHTASVSQYAIDVGLNILADGSPNATGDVYIQWVAITTGKVDVLP